MKFDKSKITYIPEDDHLYRVLHDGKIFSFTIPCMRLPFGVDEEYQKIVCRFEFPREETTQHKHLRRIVEKIEKYVSERFDVKEGELKSVIRSHETLPDLFECRVKRFRNTIGSKVEYEDRSKQYRKCILDVPTKSYVTAKVEWFGVYDYRNAPVEEGEDPDRTHKIGVVLFVKELYVMRKGEDEGDTDLS
jgi:hypothetical protein